MFLLTDGEETALLGAQAFVNAKAEYGVEVGRIINLEARGVRGPAGDVRDGPSQWRPCFRLGEEWRETFFQLIDDVRLRTPAKLNRPHRPPARWIERG